MDTFRFVLAMLIWATVPPAFLYWYLIHPFAGYWKTQGAVRTLLIVVPVCLIALGFMVRNSGVIAPTDLGTNYLFFYTGLTLWGVSIAVDRRVRRLLDFPTLAGIPELESTAAAQGGAGEVETVPAEGGAESSEAGDAAEAGGEVAPTTATAHRLLDEGPYAMVRHPRYAATIIGTIGFAFMANHGATWIMAVATIPLVLGVIRFEEEELLERMGDQYREYRDRVPALIPRPGTKPG